MWICFERNALVNSSNLTHWGMKDDWECNCLHGALFELQMRYLFLTGNGYDVRLGQPLWEHCGWTSTEITDFELFGEQGNFDSVGLCLLPQCVNGFFGFLPCCGAFRIRCVLCAYERAKELLRSLKKQLFVLSG